MKGHIRRRGPNSWVLVVDVGKTREGKRQQRWLALNAATKTEAEAERIRLLREMQTGFLADSGRMTVSEYLEQWLTDYASARVAPKTFEDYANLVRRHLEPALGHHRLGKLQPLHIQAAYAKALKSGKVNGSGLSPRSVELQHRVLREALQHAVKMRLIAVNPADAVTPPRPVHKEMTVLNTAEQARLLEFARKTHLYVPILIALTTGLRRGEIFALKWGDVDFRGGVLAVRRSLSRISAGLIFTEPKTAKSRRLVSLPSITIEALKKQRLAQTRNRKRLGAAFSQDSLIFAQEDGRAVDPGGTTTLYRSIVKKAEVPAIRFHDLRHTHATTLLSCGVHPKVVAERLGHSTVKLTMDVYSHVLPGLQEDCARKVDKALRSALDAAAATKKTG